MASGHAALAIHSPETLGGASGESCSSMKITDRGRAATGAPEPGSRWVRKNAISSPMNGYFGSGTPRSGATCVHGPASNCHGLLSRWAMRRPAVR